MNLDGSGCGIRAAGSGSCPRLRTPGPRFRIPGWGEAVNPIRAAICVAAALFSLGAAQPVTVCAAISLSDALEAIAKEYAAAGGGAVRFNFAGSNTLAQQIAHGAPADLFISADVEQMNVAIAANAIDSSTWVPLLANRLAIVTRRGGPAISDGRDLAQPAITRIAIGDPAAVPAGVYARRYLENLHVWESVQDRIVPVANVRAALAAVTNGSVDAAIVYQSDIGALDVQAAIVNGRGTPNIIYPAAIIRRSGNRDEARRFLAFLRGPQAYTVFSRYRFMPLGPH
jgi:molybdate transport system substrate-binding protein